jgi:hypothetical protein
MNSCTTIEKYAITKVLSYIMKADGIIHPKEEKYMDKIYSDLSITSMQFSIIAKVATIFEYKSQKVF